MEITPLQSSARHPKTAPAEGAAAHAAAREFEAMFLAQAVEEMLRSVDIGAMGGGHAEETWRSFLARAYADELAARGTTGIAQSVEAAMAAYGTGEQGK